MAFFRLEINMNHSRILFCLIISGLSLFYQPSGILADTDKKAVYLDTVVVTAQKMDTPFRTGDVDAELFSGSMSAILRDRFEGKMESLAEAVEKEAGIQVRQSGGLGSFSTVSLRGSTSEQVMVYLDGIPLNGASGGGVDLSHFTLSDVESVEVYRGVTPINFGQASIGGALNLKTLRSRKGFNGSVNAGYGSFETHKLAGFINYKPAKWDVLVSADQMAGDNDYDILDDNGTEWNSADDHWEKRNNADFRQHNILAKCGYDISTDMRIDFLDQWFSKHQGLPGLNNSIRTNAALDTRRNISTLNFTADNLGEWHINTRTRLSYSWKEEEYDDRLGHIGRGDQHDVYETRRWEADFFMELPTEMHILGFTCNFQHDVWESEDKLGLYGSISSSRDRLSIGIQDTLRFLDEQLLIIPALRGTFIEDDLARGTSVWGKPMAGGTRHEDNLSPQIGGRYQVLEWLVLKANAAMYSREPSFFEIYGDRGLFLGNSDLKKESGINLDAGFEADWRPEQKWMERVAFRMTGFHSKVDDLIARVYDSHGVGKSVNIANAAIQGIEAGFNVDVLDFFRITGNGTWLDTENRHDSRAIDGNQLPGKPEISWLGRLEARYKGVKVWYEYVIEDDMYYDAANLVAAEDKKEHNAGMSWLFRSMLLSVDVKNLGGDHYEDFNGYPMPGRSVNVNVKYDF